MHLFSTISAERNRPQGMTLTKMTGRRRLCFVSTIPFTINVFLRAHINVLKADYDVTVVANGAENDVRSLLGPTVSFVPLRIERNISIGKDVIALFGLWRLFRREQFDCVHSIMPKSGLLSMVAARLAGVKCRVHTFTGQVWANKEGFRRLVLICFDRLLVANATCVFADSHSQRDFLVINKVVTPGKIAVLADGSFSGVNLKRFTFNPKARDDIRKSLGIPNDAVTFIFLGRLNRDKGLLDLANAFERIALRDPRVQLMIVGFDDGGLDQRVVNLGEKFGGRVHRVTFTDHPESYLSAGDVLCLPSYREGFPAVLIEAAAIGLPVIASRIYGITDAVIEGVTGILHQPRAEGELAEAMQLLASDERLRRKMGDAARKRVAEKFSEDRVTKALADSYKDMFAGRGMVLR